MKFNYLLIVTVVSIFTISAVGQSVYGYGGPPENNSANNYTVEISTNQESYLLGESIIFSGSVNKYDEDRSLRITIFDSSKNLISDTREIISVLAKTFNSKDKNSKYQKGNILEEIKKVFLETSKEPEDKKDIA